MVALLACNNENLLNMFTAGVVEAIVLLLQSSNISTVQQNALAVLENLTGRVPASHAALVTAGGIPRLVELLQSDSEFSQDKAAAIFANISAEARGNPVCIAAASAVSPLIKLLVSGSDAVQLSAASALGNLAFNVGLQAELISAGVFLPLVNLLRSKCMAVQERAVGLLMGLTQRSDAQVRAIVASPCVHSMARLLRPLVGSAPSTASASSSANVPHVSNWTPAMLEALVAHRDWAVVGSDGRSSKKPRAEPARVSVRNNTWEGEGMQPIGRSIA